MKSDTTKYIWFNGKMVPWADAKVHVTAHALHYGSAVFEGIRAYATKKVHKFSVYKSTSTVYLTQQRFIVSL